MTVFAIYKKAREIGRKMTRRAQLPLVEAGILKLNAVTRAAFHRAAAALHEATCKMLEKMMDALDYAADYDDDYRP